MYISRRMAFALVVSCMGQVHGYHPALGCLVLSVCMTVTLALTLLWAAACSPPWQSPAWNWWWALIAVVSCMGRCMGRHAVSELMPGSDSRP